MRVPVLSVIFLFVISFLIDLYISVDIKKIWKKKGQVIFWITAMLCYALLIVALCLPRRDAESGLGPVMWLLFTFLTIYTGKLAYLIVSLLGRLVALCCRVKSITAPFRWIALFFGVSLAGIMWIGASYTRRHIVVEEETFYSRKLPASFNNYRIVQISDLHVGTWGKDTSFIKSLVDTVNGMNPDLIVFTGDIVNRETGELLPFTDILSQLRAKDGVYSILGNHDYGDYVDWPTPRARRENNLRLASHQRNMGWKLLNNEATFIRNGVDSILLIGVENWGEPPFPKYGDLDKALSPSGENETHQNDSNFKLLLSHNPEHWNREVSRHTNIDLTLSGHTHAMQMMMRIGKLKWSPAKYRYEQWGGSYSRENDNGEITHLYVNTGTGAVGMPARLFSAYPEVTLITLKKEERHK